MSEAATVGDKLNRILNRDKSKSRAIDVDLVGDWTANGSLITIESDGWYYLVSPSQNYVIAADGSTLTFTDPTPDVVYQRKFGSGTDLIGVWTLTEVYNGDTWIEEWTLRSDGTYTSHWTVNGNFDTEWIGDYVAQGSDLVTREKRALVTTTPTDQIDFDLPWDPDYSGTYVKHSANSWTLSINGNSVQYTRR